MGKTIKLISASALALLMTLNCAIPIKAVQTPENSNKDVPVTIENTLDKSELQKVYDEYRGYVPVYVTYQNYITSYNNAVTKAETVLANASATEKEIQDAIDLLTNSYWFVTVHEYIDQYNPDENNFDYSLYETDSIVRLYSLYREASTNCNIQYSGAVYTERYRTYSENFSDYTKKIKKDSGENNVFIGLECAKDLAKKNDGHSRGQFTIEQNVFEVDGKRNVELKIRFENNGINSMSGKSTTPYTKTELSKVKINLRYFTEAKVQKGLMPLVTTAIDGDFSNGLEATVNITDMLTSQSDGRLQGYYGAQIVVNSSTREDFSNGYYRVDIPGADKSELQDLVDHITSLKAEDYSEPTWNRLQATLSDVNKVLNNGNATQVEVDEALTKLQKAVNELEVISINKTLLQTAVDVANEVTESELDKVVPAVANEFRAALQEATELLINQDATQEQLDKSFDRLASVMQKLSFFKGDKKALNNLVDRIQKLDRNNYISTTLTAVDAELTKALSVIADVNAMVEEVNKATDSLTRAFLQLRLKPNKALLEELINQAEKIDANLYTAESYKAVTTALEKAKSTFATEDVTQVVVDKVNKDLKNALDGLKEVSQTEKPEQVTKPETGVTGSETMKPEAETTTKPAVKTGDDVTLGLFAGLIAMSGIVAQVFGKKRSARR